MAKGCKEKIVKINDIFNVKKSLQKYWLYIVPGQSKVQNWFCKGCGHIAILTHDQRSWYLIDPQPAKLKIQVLPFEVSDDFPAPLAVFLKAKYCIELTIKIDEIIQPQYRWWYLFIPRFVSCVSIVSYLVGIKLKGITPLGAIKYLKKLNFGKVKDAIKDIKFIDFDMED